MDTPLRGLTNAHLFYCKIYMFCYIENQANLIGKDVIFVKHMCVKS